MVVQLVVAVLLAAAGYLSGQVYPMPTVPPPVPVPCECVEVVPVDSAGVTVGK